MTGDYAGDVYGNAVGHDGMEWQLVTAEAKSEGFGHWKEWRENGGVGRPIGYGNAKFARVGGCNVVGSTAGTIDAFALEKQVLVESQRAPRRYRRDGTEALGPMDLDQQAVPLQ